MYTNWIKEQLKITNVKVKKWVEWNPDSDVYEAFYEQRTRRREADKLLK